MATFRCYFLSDDEHIRAAEIIEAGTPDEAIEKGLALLSRRARYPAIEIWQGATKVFSTALRAPSASNLPEHEQARSLAGSHALDTERHAEPLRHQP